MPTEAEGKQNTEDSIGQSQHSQTNDCVEYLFGPAPDGFYYSFIDSPGLGDTRGTAQDDVNLDKILRAITGPKESHSYLHAICLVINGTVARSTVNLVYALERMKNSLPTVILSNIFVIMTNSIKGIPTNYPKAQLHSIIEGSSIPNHVHYLMAPFFKTLDGGHSSGDAAVDHTSVTGEELDELWYKAFAALEEVCGYISETTAISASDFKAMAVVRNKIKAELASLETELGKLDAVKQALKQAEKYRLHSEASAKQYQNYTSQKQVSTTPHYPSLVRTTAAARHATHPHNITSQ